MALPTVQDAKSYLRIEQTTEDSLLTLLLARAQGTIEALLGYPMTAAALTYRVYDHDPAYEIQLPGPFLATGPAPVVTDVNGAVIDAASYILDASAGKIRWSFRGPYTVVATVGLSAHPDYAARLEAIAATAIIDMFAHLYENRYPGMSAEGSGGVSLEADAIPTRIISSLMALPCTRGLILA